MSQLIVAAIKLSVKGKFSDRDLNAVQTILRKHGKSTILSIDDDDMQFYIRGEDTIDYSVLDKIKAKLTEFQLNFVITADEYTLLNEKKYYYASGDNK